MPCNQNERPRLVALATTLTTYSIFGNPDKTARDWQTCDGHGPEARALSSDDRMVVIRVLVEEDGVRGHQVTPS